MLAMRKNHPAVEGECFAILPENSLVEFIEPLGSEQLPKFRAPGDRQKE
jgi:hypothetical protein